MNSGKREVIFVDLSCPAKTFTRDKDTLYNILQSIKFMQRDGESSANSLTAAETINETPVSVSVLSDHEFYIRKRRLERAQVATEVDNLLWNLPQEKRTVYIKGLPNLAYGVIVGIVNDLRGLGYDRFALIAAGANGQSATGVNSRRPSAPKKAGESSGVQDKGAGDLLVVTVETETRGRIIARVGEAHVPLSDLAGKVRTLLKDRANRNVKIVAPDTITYGTVVEVIDAVKAAGAEAIVLGDDVQSP